MEISTTIAPGQGSRWLTTVAKDTFPALGPVTYARMPVPAVARGSTVPLIRLTTASVAGSCSPVAGQAIIMAALPSGLTTTGVTLATPRTAVASAAPLADRDGSVAAMISGASNPGLNPLAI